MKALNKYLLNFASWKLAQGEDFDRFEEPSKMWHEQNQINETSNRCLLKNQIFTCNADAPI